MNTSTRRTAVAPEWFATWFDSPHYHRLYAHRDEREAAGLIDRLIERLQPEEGASALDLGCGTGRHARRLAAKGLDVTGIDLSAESIRTAERSRAANLRFERQDIRTPFGDARFDYVFSLFTSFGYFDDPADDLQVVRNIAASLKPGGRLVLDYLNVCYAAANLKAHDTIERDGTVYQITRWSDARHIHKRILVHDASASAPVAYVERVARLTLGDFRFLFSLYGLEIEEVFGGYQLQPFDEAASDRLLLVCTTQRAPKTHLPLCWSKTLSHPLFRRSHDSRASSLFLSRESKQLTSVVRVALLAKPFASHRRICSYSRTNSAGSYLLGARSVDESRSV